MQCSRERTRGGHTKWNRQQNRQQQQQQWRSWSNSPPLFMNSKVYYSVHRCLPLGPHWPLQCNHYPHNLFRIYPNITLSFTHRSPEWHSTFEVSDKVFNEFITCNMGATCSTHFKCLHLKILTICGDDYQFTGFSHTLLNNVKIKKIKLSFYLRLVHLCEPGLSY